MTFTITIKTDNAAFEDDRSGEIGRILHKWVNESQGPCHLYDINGNHVGTVKVRGDRQS